MSGESRPGSHRETQSFEIPEYRCGGLGSLIALGFIGTFFATVVALAVLARKKFSVTG